MRGARQLSPSTLIFHGFKSISDHLPFLMFRVLAFFFTHNPYCKHYSDKGIQRIIRHDFAWSSYFSLAYSKALFQSRWDVIIWPYYGMAYLLKFGSAVKQQTTSNWPTDHHLRGEINRIDHFQTSLYHVNLLFRVLCNVHDIHCIHCLIKYIL